MKKVSVVLPAYMKAPYLTATLDSWFQFKNIPDEIIIGEDYTPENVKPEDRLLPVIEKYRWPQGVAVRYFQRDTTLRAMYPQLEDAIRCSAKKYGVVVTEEQIADTWHNGGTLIGNGASNKNFIARVATGDILISTDPENIQTVDVIDIAQRRLSAKVALYASKVYQVAPATGEVEKVWCERTPYWYTVVMRRQDYLAVGGIPEIFDSQWGWEDEAFALSLRKNGITIDYPPRLVVHHQNHHKATGRVFVNHNKEAKIYYENNVRDNAIWVNNESRGHYDWGSEAGWKEIDLTPKRSS